MTARSPLPLQQLVLDAVQQGVEAGGDDVLAHADGVPGVGLVGGFDEDAGLGAGGSTRYNPGQKSSSVPVPGQ